MYTWLVLSHDEDRIIVHKQGLDSPNRLRALTDKDADNI